MMCVLNSMLLQLQLTLTNEIVWINPTTSVTSFISTVNLKANVYSKIPIEKIEVQVNGLAVYSKLLEGENTYAIDHTIQVSAGINTIKIVSV